MGEAFLYRWLRPLAKPLARTFHRHLVVEHAERVPSVGPVVFASNHPNMMLDVLLLAAGTPRTLHFLGKATLFRNPILGSFLRLAGVLPVHRRNESPGRMTENVDTFVACHRLLAAGGAIALFPEGVSHDRDAVLPLKTGCARIVLEAEAKNGFGLACVIVPLGITFSNRELFRSDALVLFGEPLDPSHHFDDYRKDPPAAVRALTRELEAALQRLTLHVPREEDERLLRTLRGFFAEETTPTSDRLLIDRTLVRAISDFRDRHPLEFARLRRKVLGYGRVLEVLGLSQGELDRSYHLGPVVRYLLPRALFAAAGLPLFMVGAAFHYLPYKIPALVARQLATEPVERATLKLLSGMLTFPVFYALALVLGIGPFVLALLPPLGIFSLIYSEAVSELYREVQLFLRRERVLPFRQELAAELEAHRREYEALENRPLE